MNRRVLIFGTFDGYNAGHQYVISEAAKKGTELVVAVALDEHVRILKHKSPFYHEEIRRDRVAKDKCVSRAVFSDKDLGSYMLLDEIKPDVIVLGFDQTELADDLSRWMKSHREIPIETIPYLNEHAPNLG